MLEEFNFALVEPQKDMEFVKKTYEKHDRKLKHIREAIAVKQKLKGKFTVEELDEYTDYIAKTQQVQQSKIVASQYIQFLEQLTVPFEQKKNQLRDKISDILLMSIIKPYQKEVVQSIKTRLIRYKTELDDRDEQNFRIIENSKTIPLFMSEDSHIMEPKVQLVLLEIVRRDFELSKVFECVDIQYESTLLGRVFNKLYQVTRNIIVLGPKFTLGEVQLVLKHVQHLFIRNCNYLKTIVDSPTVCSYCIKELYKCLVARNVVDILAKGNLSSEESYFLVDRVLKLETDIKAKTNTDHDINDRQSLLNVIYKQNKKLFQQLLSFQEKKFSEKIFENPTVANCNQISDVQKGFEAFKILLKDNYTKYIGMSNCEYKQMVDRRFSKIVSRMISYFNLNVSALMKENSDLNRLFEILQYEKTVENQIDNNQLISQIKKHNKAVQQAMDLLKSDFNKKFASLSQKEYQYQKSGDRIFSESQWVGKLLKSKSNTTIQKDLFLRRMRSLFFKFIGDYKFKKVYLNKFLDIFSPSLYELFKNRCVDLIEVIQSGNTAQKYKELTFITLQERADVSKLKVVE